jgi:epoxyqueuosine reductase
MIVSLTLSEQQSRLEALAREQGASLFGVADLQPLLERQPDLLSRVPGSYTRAVVIGVRLNAQVISSIQDAPTPIYAHHYMQVNYLLDRIALSLSVRMEEWGHAALPIPASQVVSNRPMQGHVSHRLLGWAAGLGRIGRSTLLVNPKYGAQVRYVSILTTMPLQAGQPLEQDCGSCHACQKLCPAGAIHDASTDYDVTACHKTIQDFSKLPFIGHQICGICVKACCGQDH